MNSTWAVRSHILPALGHHPLIRLSPAHVAEFLRDKRDAGLAPNTVMRFRSVLIAALDHAVLEGLVVRNVASLVRAPLGRTTEGRTLTVEQATAFLDAAKGERLSAALTTMLMLGLRPGEVLALRWRDVDLDQRVLHVRYALKRERKQLRIGLPQDGALVPVAAPAGADWRDLDLVFPTTNGSLTDPSNFRRDFDRITTKAGLGHWHPHELRHSAVSLLSAAGVPIEVVADLMGHATTRTTERVYRHLVNPVHDGAVDAIEKLFRRRDAGNDASPDIR